jgi:hypothetical protein
MFFFLRCCSRKAQVIAEEEMYALPNISYSMDTEGFQDCVELEEGEVCEQPVIPRVRRSKSYYNHKYWPSPRPINFVKYLRKQPFYEDTNPVKVRLTHMMALDILAKNAGCSVDELLTINPITYVEKYLHVDSKNLRSFLPLKGSYNKLYDDLRWDKAHNDYYSKLLSLDS